MVRKPTDPQQQRCKACGLRDKWNFYVPDEIWRMVVPVPLRNRVDCLACFDDFAKRRKVAYAAHIRDVYFAGDRAAFEFRAWAAADVAD
jgi:hypothetical protein